MTLRVLEPGWCTLVVDAGRPSYRSLGVPLGGAADRTALALGNALVGNGPAAAALEVSLAGPTLQADVQLACVVYGAPFAVTHIRGAFSERPDFRDIPAGQTFTLAAGDQVHIGSTPAGMRAYFCVGGGLQVAEILESRSSLEPVRAGALLPCSPGRIHGRLLPRFVSGKDNPAPRDRRTHISELLAPLWQKSPGPVIFRVVEGLQASWFKQQEFFDQQFTVTPAANRMGLRLEGRPLTMPARELVSEPVCPGAVQATSDGQCIILGVDGQTIGGYPKIAQVIQADLDHLGQLRPGDRLRFAPIGLDEATRLERQRREELLGWIVRLRTTFSP